MQNTGLRHKLRNFRDMVVWQRAHTVCLSVYSNTETFPPSEQYSLTSQMRRAAISITSNIAEGYGRIAPNDKHHFYIMACGSARELQSQMSLAKDLGYMSFEDFSSLDESIEEVLRLLNSLRKSLKT